MLAFGVLHIHDIRFQSLDRSQECHVHEECSVVLYTYCIYQGGGNLSIVRPRPIKSQVVLVVAFVPCAISQVPCFRFGLAR